MLIIIFGTRGVPWTIATGEFHCPSCGAGQAFRHRRVRRFFTLYFIPLVPLDALGEYVECLSCKGTYDPQVLSYDPEAADREFQAAFEVAVRRVLVAMMAADRVIDDGEVAAIQDIHRQVTGRGIGPDEIREEAAALGPGGGDVREHVAAVAPVLNTHGKEMVVKAAFLVAAADGEVGEEELEALAALSKGLDMSAAHFNGIVLELQQAGG